MARAKLPLPKRCVDLQWRVLEGPLATKMFLSTVGNNVGEGCVFCNMPWSVHHVFVECQRLLSLLSVER